MPPQQTQIDLSRFGRFDVTAANRAAEAQKRAKPRPKGVRGLLPAPPSEGLVALTQPDISREGMPEALRVAPALSVEREPYARPLGEDILGDIIDFAGGATFADGLAPDASTAMTLGMAGTLGAPGMLAKTGRGLYSKLLEGFRATLPKTVKADSLLNLAKRVGAKDEEILTVGLRELAEGNRGRTLDRDTVLQHVEARVPKVDTDVLGAPSGKDLQWRTSADGSDVADYGGGQFSLYRIDDGSRYDGQWMLESPTGYVSRFASREEALAKANSAPKQYAVKPTKFSQHTLPGGPLSRDTELLTSNGWVRIDRVKIGNAALTRTEAGDLEWASVEALPQVHAPILYHFFNQSIDMQVTPEHQMIAQKRRVGVKRTRGRLERMTAVDLWQTSEYTIPLTGNYQDASPVELFGLPANDVAELVGWYLAEGSAKQKRGRKSTLQIAQSRLANPAKCARLEALFDRLGIQWGYSGGNYTLHITTMPPDLVALLHAQGRSHEKFVPALFFTAGRAVAERLLEALILGDGCTVVRPQRQARLVYASKSQQLADGVQILAALCGMRATVRLRKSGLYLTSICHKQFASVDDAKHAIVDYNDTAFCVTVKNHAIYVRRRGVAAWTGNSNYRETLITLPTDNKAKAQAEFVRLQEQMNVETDPAKLDAITSRMRALQESQPEFRSGHFDTPNVLTHIRHNDRTTPEGGRVRFLEEVQSDWHQKGKERGYGNAPPTKQEQIEMIKHSPSTRQWMERADEEGEDAFNTIIERYAAGDVNHNVLVNRLESMGIGVPTSFYATRNGVPDAPFKDTWPDLALKQQLTEAAEGGYDFLGLTPGKVQADRYDLSKHVSNVQLIQRGDGRVYVRATGLDGSEALPMTPLEEKPLADFIGKDAAAKLEAQEWGDATRMGNGWQSKQIEGLDLQVGGEGMRSFYDELLPKRLEKLVKPFGGKVERGGVVTGETPDPFFITWRDEMPQEMGGMPPPQGLQRLRGFTGEDESDEVLSFLPGATQGDAFDYRNMAARQLPSQTVDSWLTKLTPEIRDRILKEGFPLFILALMAKDGLFTSENEKLAGPRR